MNRPHTATIARSLSVAILIGAVSLAASACGEAGPTPVPGKSTAAATASPTPAPTATPVPTPGLVRSITLVATMTDPRAATQSGLAWTGVQSVAAKLGAKSALTEVAPDTDATEALNSAAAADGAVVVTVGPDTSAAVLTAAAAHPATQFLEVGVVVPDTAPANVHGIVADQAQAGYLAGFVAASYAAAGKIGMAGDAAADPATINYGAGIKAGAQQANPAVAVTITVAGASDSPEKGRTTSASLVKAGNTVIVAMPSITGIGAMRDACGRKARLVAVETDAWLAVTDVKTCLIASVVSRYDASVSGAAEALSGGATLPRNVLMNVSNGGIALSELHVAAPAGFQAKLDALLATLAGS